MKITTNKNNTSNTSNSSNEKEDNKKRNKPQEKQMMHSAICHCLLTDTQPVPEQFGSSCQLPAVHMLSMMFSGWFRPAVLTMLSPGILCTCSLSGHGKLKSP